MNVTSLSPQHNREFYSNTCKAVMLALYCGLLPNLAMADASNGIFCFISDQLKLIVGSAALVAIAMWAIEHIFGASKLHDITMRVGIACAVVGFGAIAIAKSGLTVNC